MKILYLSLDPPLDVEKVATGNQVRAQGIREVLEQAGHEVVQLAPASTDSDPGITTSFFYQTRDELGARIREENFDAVFAGYWSLLAHLPETSLPVILDFIAPRILEQMFQEPESLQIMTAELTVLLRVADRFLVGNRRQADLLLPLLLQAGFDCRSSVPVSIIPISVRGKCEPSGNEKFPLRIVNAGVDWPWRDTAAYRTALGELASMEQKIEFRELVGSYPGSSEEKDYKSTLVSYKDMQSELCRCHIGMELGARNTEREFSHSFRAMEYLECGLPVIINEWIPLAEKIREFDAGWVIKEPKDLEPVLEQVLADPSVLASKQAGVTKLTETALNYRISCIPLLEYLAVPVKAMHFDRAGEAVQEAGETPDLKDFVEKAPGEKASTLKIILGSLFKILFCPKRPDATPDVLMVTRADLFPTDHGAAVKIIRTAEALSRQGRDVWLATDNRKEYYQFSEGIMHTRRFPLLVRFFCLPRILAFMQLLMKGYPVSNSFLYLPVTDSSYIVRAVYLTSRKPIGAYQAEFPAYVRPLRYARSLFGGKLLLVQHNVEYERIRNQVPDLTDKNFHALKNLEVAMCRLADQIVAVSENDRQKMIHDGIEPDKIHTIPHGVDLQAFRETKVTDIRERYGLPGNRKILVYHGTYSYPPNLEAMEVMARELLPRLEQRPFKVSVLAIGSKPPDFPLHADIHFVGSVENLAEVIPAADIAVVPLQDGGGTRMKILDYFAAGVPVVSTTKGIEGIPVRNGVEALIIDDYEGMCDAIARLLEQPETAASLSEAAGRFVDSLSWDAIVRRYLPLLQ